MWAAVLADVRKLKNNFILNQGYKKCPSELNDNNYSYKIPLMDLPKNCNNKLQDTTMKISYELDKTSPLM